MERTSILSATRDHRTQNREKKQNKDVEEMKKEVQGRKLTDVIDRVKALHNTWRFRKICLDATGLGVDPADQFEESGLPIDAFEFNLKTKQDINENLQLMREQSEMGGRANDEKLNLNST